MEQFRFLKEYKNFKVRHTMEAYGVPEEKKKRLVEYYERVYRMATGGEIILDEAMMKLAKNTTESDWWYI